MLRSCARRIIDSPSTTHESKSIARDILRDAQILESSVRSFRVNLDGTITELKP